jgi:hypothetical protein
MSDCNRRRRNALEQGDRLCQFWCELNDTHCQ